MIENVSFLPSTQHQQQQQQFQNIHNVIASTLIDIDEQDNFDNIFINSEFVYDDSILNDPFQYPASTAAATAAAAATPITTITTCNTDLCSSTANRIDHDTEGNMFINTENNERSEKCILDVTSPISPCSPNIFINPQSSSSPIMSVSNFLQLDDETERIAESVTTTTTTSTTATTSTSVDEDDLKDKEQVDEEQEAEQCNDDIMIEMHKTENEPRSKRSLCTETTENKDGKFSICGTMKKRRKRSIDCVTNNNEKRLLSPNALKEQRARRNRESAKRSRLKHKLYLHSLESKYYSVSGENHSLKLAVEQLLPPLFNQHPSLKFQLRGLFEK